ncbi:MAG: gliding motility-associated C-terminal domain-containing protein [Elusimicrobia bacterium]|nr:gliding motility-associated C-terminal domain-containing protein [Elusimicrobiota bacterium]
MLHKIACLALALISAAVASPLAPRGFSYTGLVNRFVTPNGDGKNDTAIFQYLNPQDSAGSIRIYELGGRQVATISIETNTTFAAWNPSGYANGVYVYVIEIDQTIKSGVLVVVR